MGGRGTHHQPVTSSLSLPSQHGGCGFHDGGRMRSGPRFPGSCVALSASAKPGRGGRGEGGGGSRGSLLIILSTCLFTGSSRRVGGSASLFNKHLFDSHHHHRHHYGSYFIYLFLPPLPPSQNHSNGLFLFNCGYSRGWIRLCVHLYLCFLNFLIEVRLPRNKCTNLKCIAACLLT